MTEWTLKRGSEIWNRHYRFAVGSAVVTPLGERIVDLLNAAEPGGIIDRVTGSVEGQCLDADAWNALCALIRHPSGK